MALSYTTGDMMVFPGKRIEGKWTINQARVLEEISDQFDFTVECIRRHYARQSSPLSETLARHDDFFALFESFSGYVDFSVLQDLVTDVCADVRFFMPVDQFRTASVPEDDATYKQYLRRASSSSKLEIAGSSDTRPLHANPRLATSRHPPQPLHLPQPPVELVPTGEI